MSAPLSLLRRARTRAAAAVLLSAALFGGSVAVSAGSSPAVAATRPNRAATAVNFALSALGTPYKWGGNGPGGFDCSGLTAAAYHAAGIEIPRTSRAQFAALPHVPQAKGRVGDLAFWAKDPKDPTTIYHVAMYIGGGMVVSAPQTGQVVQVKPLQLRNLLPVFVRPAGLSAPAVIPVERGSRGDDVRSVQRRLRANGFPVPVTGVYDAATYRAIARIRVAAGRVPNHGTVGTHTWQYLVRHGARTASR